MDKITLDGETFKALASDTRLAILKALDERQKTVTELAREIDLNKATVHEHLEKLETAKLIQKIEDDRKWVYWQLSWTGRRLLHPEKITVAILLSTAGGALVAALAALALWYRSRPDPVSDASPETMSVRAVEAAPAAPAAADPLFLFVAAGFALLTLALAGYALHVRRKARRAEPS